MLTKLMQWVIGFSLFMAIWASVVFDMVLKDSLSNASREVILHLPIYAIIVFGCYSLAVVGYRTATFNDCPEAAEELKKEIEQAKRDLKKKGVTIDS